MTGTKCSEQRWVAVRNGIMSGYTVVGGRRCAQVLFTSSVGAVGVTWQVPASFVNRLGGC